MWRMPAKKFKWLLSFRQSESSRPVYHDIFILSIWTCRRRSKEPSKHNVTMATKAGPPAAKQGEEEDNDTSPHHSYVSPDSSGHNEGKESELSSPEQPKRDTINITRQNSSDSEIPLVPPVHQFVAYSTNIYDSDTSDGR